MKERGEKEDNELLWLTEQIQEDNDKPAEATEGYVKHLENQLNEYRKKEKKMTTKDEEEISLLDLTKQARHITKIKMFYIHTGDTTEDEVNEFIKDKFVLDVKVAVSEHFRYVMVIYKE